MKSKIYVRAEISGLKENKFSYTTEQSRVIGQEQLCPKIMKKVK